ncbi:MAG: ComF family protein [Vibrio sp.]
MTSNQNRCPHCGLPHAHNQASENLVCGECLASPPPWDRLYCINDYRSPLKDYIQKLKYQRQFWLAKDLAILLAENIPTPAHELIPVPLHWTRQWRRGFNQSTELAEQMAQFWKNKGIECQVNERVFKRIRATPQQKGLSKVARQKNIKQAYKLITPPKYQHIALIDDVVTTGSTIRPLCLMLKKAGVKHIDVYCLSRTPSPK